MGALWRSKPIVLEKTGLTTWSYICGFCWSWKPCRRPVGMEKSDRIGLVVESSLWLYCQSACQFLQFRCPSQANSATKYHARATCGTWRPHCSMHWLGRWRMSTLVTKCNCSDLYCSECRFSGISVLMGFQTHSFIFIWNYPHASSTCCEVCGKMSKVGDYRMEENVFVL